MGNNNLSDAKRAKNDEFYTQYADIQKEINAYLSYDPDVFRDKVILLPCDDPEWSNFTKFFAQNFERFGIKKLISTSYACASKGGVEKIVKIIVQLYLNMLRVNLMKIKQRHTVKYLHLHAIQIKMVASI